MIRSETPIPWLSGLLLAACIAFGVDVRLSEDAAMQSARAEIDAVEAYFLEHPYLAPGPLLAARLGEGRVGHERRAYTERRDAAGGAPIPRAVVRRQQAALDARLDALAEGVRGLASRRFAVAPGSDPSLAWAAYALWQPSVALLVAHGLLLLYLGVFLEGPLGRAGFAATAVFGALAAAWAWARAGVAPEGWGLVGFAPPLAGLLAAFAVLYAARARQPFYAGGVAWGGLGLALPAYAGAGGWFEPIGVAAAGPPPAAASLYLVCAAAGGIGAVAGGIVRALGAERSAGPVSQIARHPLYRRAARARRAGRPREALELLEELLARQPHAYEAALAVFEIEAERGHDLEAASALVRVTRIELERGWVEAAIRHWLEIVEDGIPEKADSGFLVRMAIALREAGLPTETVLALRCALERADDRSSRAIAARVARAARGLDPDVTEAAAWHALGSIDLELEERQALEAMLGEILMPGGAPRKAAS